MSPLAKYMCLLALTLCCVQAVSAGVTVKNLQITPSSDLVSGETPVTADFIVQFTGSGGETFPAEDSLVMSTDLESAEWKMVLVNNGIENPPSTEKGRNVEVNGWVLSYPSSKNDVSMKVSLAGTTPKVTASGNATLIRVAEQHNREVVPGTEVIRTRFVLNPGEIDSVITQTRADIAAFQHEINAQSSQGVPTSGAQGKHDEASTAIQSADSASSYAVAQGYITQAQTAVKDGRVLLNKEITQKQIAEVDASIAQTDELITYFKVNRSMSNDPRLAPILAEQELAQGFLSEAKDMMNQGNFDASRQKAAEASVKATAAYNNALELRKSLGGEGSDPTGGLIGGITGGISGGVSGLASIAMYVGIIAVVAVLAFVGIVLFRRRRRWDELG